MNERPKARLYVAEPFAPGGSIELAPGQAHHLRTVLRLGAGAVVAAFNATDGEWLCRITETGRSRVVAHGRTPDRGRPRPKRICGSCLHRSSGPVSTGWSRRRPNLASGRYCRCGRSEPKPSASISNVCAPTRSRPPSRASDSRCLNCTNRKRSIACWPAGQPERRLIVCDETGGGEPIGAAVARLGAGPTALLTGPEGGFAETELDALGKLSFVTRVGLGPRVLRADTAALAALAVFQAIAGDWRRVRGE